MNRRKFLSTIAATSIPLQASAASMDELELALQRATSLTITGISCYGPVLTAAFRGEQRIWASEHEDGLVVPKALFLNTAWERFMYCT